MICTYCGNEIGNQSQCPYCGNLMRPYAQADSERTFPVNWNNQNSYTPDPETVRHFRNMDRWGALSIIILTAIFILEILQLALQIM